MIAPLRFLVGHPTASLLALLSVAIVVLSTRNGYLEGKAARAEQRATVAEQNVLAAQSVTENLEGRYRRLIMQIEQEADSLQRALDERPVLTTTVTVQAPPERREEPVATRQEEDSVVVYTYDFDVAVLEIEVDWLAQLPPIVTLEPKPISLTYRVACGPNGPIVDIEPDGDQELDIQGSVDPGLCNPVVAPQAGSRVSFLYGLAAGAAAILAVGALR